MANLLILEWNQLAVILEQIVCFIVNFGVFHETDCWVGCGVEFVWLKLPNLQIRGEIIDVGDNYVTLEFFFFLCVCVVILCSFALLIYFWCVLICCFWFWVRWNWLRVWSRSWVWRLKVTEFADFEWIGCCLLDVRVNYVLLLKGQFLFLLEVSALNLWIWKEMIGVS